MISNNWKILAVTNLFALSATFTAFAGGESSSGGGAMVCRDAQGNITSAELLDLWEIQFREDKAQVVRTDEDMETQLENAVLRVKGGYGSKAESELRKVLGEVRSSILEVKPGIELSPPTDALNTFNQVGCKLEGVALFNDRKNRLYINPSILNAMPRTDQAALLVHEAIYLIRRRFLQETNSIPTRDYVGRLFSTNYAQILWEPDSYILCDGKKIKGLFFKIPGDKDIESGYVFWNLNLSSALAVDGAGPRMSVLDKGQSERLDYVDRKLTPAEEVVAWDLLSTKRVYSSPSEYQIHEFEYSGGRQVGRMEFSYGIEGMTPGSGAMMTIENEQNLYADVDFQHNTNYTLFTYETKSAGFFKMGRVVKSITRNEAVQPLCKRYSTRERPIQW